jgi:hypothetical protein
MRTSTGNLCRLRLEQDHPIRLQPGNRIGRDRHQIAAVINDPMRIEKNGAGLAAGAGSYQRFAKQVLIGSDRSGVAGPQRFRIVAGGVAQESAGLDMQPTWMAAPE